MSRRDDSTPRGAEPILVDDRVVAVGLVRAPWKDTQDIPLQGAPAILEIAPGYEAALDHIERSSHIVVLAWLHQADRSVLQASPRKLDATAPPWGVFATRAPVRPNPIALSTTRLLRRDGLLLHVDPLDLLDGTPVLDIKSYSPGWDNVFSATSTRRVSSHLLPDDTLIAFLERDLANHLGEHAGRPVARAVLGAVVGAIRHFGVDPRDPGLHVELARCDEALDAVMALTGASLANGRLAVRAEPGPQRLRFLFGGHEHAAGIG